MSVERFSCIGTTSIMYGALGLFGTSAATGASGLFMATIVPVPVGTAVFFGGLTGLVHGISLIALKENVVSGNPEKTAAIIGATFMLSSIIAGVTTNLLGGSISLLSASTLLMAGLCNGIIISAFSVAILVVPMLCVALIFVGRECCRDVTLDQVLRQIGE